MSGVNQDGSGSGELNDLTLVGGSGGSGFLTERTVGQFIYFATAPVAVKGFVQFPPPVLGEVELDIHHAAVFGENFHDEVIFEPTKLIELPRFNFNIKANDFMDQENSGQVAAVGLTSLVYPTEHFTLEVAIGGLFCLLGLICNILALVVLKKDPKKGTTVYILSALAITDWLILVYLCLVKVIPFLCVYIDAESCYGPLLQATVYIWPVGCMAQTAMIWLVVLVTVDRYIAICHPFKSAVLSTVSNAKKAIAIICVIAVLVNIPRFFYYTDIGQSNPTSVSFELPDMDANNFATLTQVQSSSEPTAQETDELISGPNNASKSDLQLMDFKASGRLELIGFENDETDFDMEEDVEDLGPIQGTRFRKYIPSPNKALGDTIWYRIVYYISFSCVFMYLIPMVTLFVLNFKLMGAIRRAKTTHASMARQKNKENKDSHSVTLNIIAVVLVFLVCQTPDFAQVVISYPDLHVDRYIISLVSASATMFMAINSSVNFFIYCLFYKKFRRLLRRLLCPGSVKSPDSTSSLKSSRDTKSTMV